MTSLEPGSFLDVFQGEDKLAFRTAWIQFDKPLQGNFYLAHYDLPKQKVKSHGLRLKAEEIIKISRAMECNLWFLDGLKAETVKIHFF